MKMTKYYVLIWKDQSIQPVQGESIEDALNNAKISRSDLKELDYWEKAGDPTYPYNRSVSLIESQLLYH